MPYGCQDSTSRFWVIISLMISVSILAPSPRGLTMVLMRRACTRCQESMLGVMFWPSIGTSTLEIHLYQQLSRNTQLRVHYVICTTSNKQVTVYIATRTNHDHSRVHVYVLRMYGFHGSRVCNVKGYTFHLWLTWYTYTVCIV